MKMRARRAAGAADVGDDVAPLDALPRLHREAVEVPVSRDHAVAVVDDQRVAVPTLLAGRDDDPVRGRLDLRAHGRRDVDARMEVLLAGEGVDAVAERGR